MYIAFFSGAVCGQFYGTDDGMKNWMPILHVDGAPSLFQNSLREMLDGNSTISCEVLEHCLLESGKQHGVYGVKNFAFEPSVMLRNLRNSRRQTVDTVRRKELSFHIHKLHPQELRRWKSTKLSACLCNPSSWKMLRGMLRTPRHEIADQPHVDDFAKMLEHLFHGDPAPPMTVPTLTKPPWTMAELRHAISRLKIKRSGDDLGLAAELLKHSPDDFLNALLHVICDMREARARKAPTILQQSVAAALTARWSATLTHAAMTPFAATLLGEATPNLYNVDTNPANWSQLLAESPPDPPSSSRLHPPA